MRGLSALKLKIILIVIFLCFYTFVFCQEPALLSLDLKEVDLKDALKIIAQASGMNIITDKDVKANITLTLKDVTWQTALENILKTNELTYRIEENTIRVMTLATVKKEEETLPLTTKIITLNFAKAEDLKTSFSRILSGRGSIEVNVPTNSLIVNDTPEVLNKVEKLAQELDIRTPQVMIRALIMSVKLTDTDKFGIDWTATYKRRSERTIAQDLDLGDVPALTLTYGKTILPQWLFNATVEFYTERKKATILANPHILTLNNRNAQIELTEQVSYTYVSESTEGGTVSTTQFKDVGIKLYVTPQITKDRFISLQVKVEQSYVASYTAKDEQPVIDSRKTETNFMLKDEETAVISGLRKKDSTVTINKVPILGSIPFLGKFFRKEVNDIVETELLVFITPTIVEEALLSTEERKKLEQSKYDLWGKAEERDEAISKTFREQKQKEEQEELLRQREEKERQAEEQRRQAELKKQQIKQEKIKQREESERQKQIAKAEKEKQRQEAEAKRNLRQEKQKEEQLKVEQKEKERLEKKQKHQEEMLKKKAEKERLKQKKQQQRVQKNIEKQLEVEQRKKELTQQKELYSQIASLYREAITYYKKNQFAQAINTFERILFLDPNQTKAKKYLEKILKITKTP